MDFAKVVLLAVLLSATSVAQIHVDRMTVRKQVPAPEQLLRQMSQRCCSNSVGCDGCSHSEELPDGQPTALKALFGIEDGSVVDVRLTYEDLDGDGVPEAVFTIEMPGQNMLFAVLKHIGSVWYRLAFDTPQTACWCKYENEPLDTFLEIRQLYDKDFNPIKLIFVRDSGGGTGLYERTVTVFSLRRAVLKTVFSYQEERRDCSWPDGKCELRHTTLELVQRDQDALLKNDFEWHPHPNQQFQEDTWWLGRPSVTCGAYTWDSKKFEFSKSLSATRNLCSEVNRDPRK